ncbi:MAG: ORF6N domain-containing protein [Bacteroidales bacterium]|nr:ORF6N domain-containing protein [Bacteroidales bacterium]
MSRSIENKIYLCRGVKVMIDSDLAEIYGVETRVLNQAVKRNIDRFPESFMFRLSEAEYKALKSQIVSINDESLASQTVILNDKNDKRGKHTKFLPYVFTEHGAVMLASVLRSETAIKASVKVVTAFIEMRRFIENNAGLFQRLESVERRVSSTEDKLDKVYRALESGEARPTQGIYSDGQIFDAWVFVSNLVKSANHSLVLIDNYVDESVLNLFLKRNAGVSVRIYTAHITKALQTDLEKHNKQYAPIEILSYTKAHDRFLIIDNNTVYHMGASLKDLGKKLFAFSKMNLSAQEMLQTVQAV